MHTSDYDDSLRFLSEVWQPGTWREVRVKGPHGVYGQAFDDPDRAASYAAEKSDDPNTVAVWLTVNPVDPATWKPDQKLATDENIPGRTHFIIDGDTVREKDQNATAAELEAAWPDFRKALDYLRGLGFPVPLIVATGNGWQAWFRIDLLASDSIVERFLKALSAQFSTPNLHIDESVFNPARLARMPGTMNRKGPDTPDRPQRLAKVIEWQPLPVVQRELLEKVAGSAPALADEAADDPADDGFMDAMAPAPFDVDGFLATNSVPVRDKKRKDGPVPGDGPGTLWEIPCVFRPDEKDGGCWIWQGDDGTIRGGCHHAKCGKKKWKDIRNKIDPTFDSSAKESLPTNIVDAEYLARRHLDRKPYHLLHRETVYEYCAGVYAERKPEAVKRSIRRTLMREFKRFGRMMKERGIDSNPPSVGEKLVSSVYGVLTSLIPEVQHAAPSWLDGRKADDLLVVENGILNLADLTLTPHTPQLFSVVKLPYQFDATALCPAWLQFVNSVWDDPDEIALAQEIAGYALESENWLQVLFLLQGATRGGKGVLLRMLCQMVGEANTCSISARNFCKDFALWGARGKAIITVPDIRRRSMACQPSLLRF